MKGSERRSEDSRVVRGVSLASSVAAGNGRAAADIDGDGQTDEVTAIYREG